MEGVGYPSPVLAPDSVRRKWARPRFGVGRGVEDSVGAPCMPECGDTRVWAWRRAVSALMSRLSVCGWASWSWPGMLAELGWTVRVALSGLRRRKGPGL